MIIIKKIDDIGRIAIPRDVRRALRWMGGDEIEIIPKKKEYVNFFLKEAFNFFTKPAFFLRPHQ